MASPSTTPVKKVAKPPRIRPATFEDYEQIAALEARHALETKSQDEWRDLWLGNPVYREFRGDWCIGWVIDDDEKIVGSMANIPLMHQFQGRRVLGASGRAWVSDAPYRSASLMLLDRLINQPGVDLYINNTVTSNSMAPQDVFNCPRVPVGLWDQSAFWITNHQGFLESFFTKKNHRMVRGLSYALAPAMLLKEKLTAKALREGDIELQACPGFDDRFDDFWEALKTRRHLLLTDRSREVLEWHFKYPLRNARLWIIAAVDGARLAGYALFDRRDSPEIGLMRVRLLDFQSLDGTDALLGPMLSWALKKCRTEGIHMLENVGRWLEPGEFIETVAPYKRDLKSWSYYYRANSAILEAELKNRSAWVPSLYDGNASL